MASRAPLVVVAGVVKELPAGDTLKSGAFAGGSVTPSPQSGSFSSASATLYYFDDGPIRLVDVTVTIVAKGSATGSVSVPLPSAPSAGYLNFAGREAAVAGFPVNGYGVAGNGSVNIYKPDLTSPIGDGYILTLQGWYRP